MAEVQLYRQNEGRHAVLLGLGRQLFRSLHDMSESDFDDEALQLYEDRERSKKSREVVTELGKRRITRLVPAISADPILHYSLYSFPSVGLYVWMCIFFLIYNNADLVQVRPRVVDSSYVNHVRYIT